MQLASDIVEMSTPSIRLIEEISFNAWPSQQTLLYDGWAIRFAEGYSRRANAIYPLYDSCGDLDAKLDHCEGLYRSHGLPTIFKLTEASQPKGLDEVLATRGYEFDAPTLIKLLDLGGWSGEADPDVRLDETATPDWFEGYWQMSHSNPKHETAARQLLANISLPKALASLYHEGKLVASGLAVAQDGYMGMYDIVTDARYRRQGFARRLITTLLAWAKGLGVHTAYLQVMENNAPARALYEQLGYKDAYRYWYRVKA